jgi:hypothetical protein
MTPEITQSPINRNTLTQLRNLQLSPKDDAPLSHLLRSKDNAGDVAAIIAKNSILTQTEKSMKVQANTSREVALALLS